MSDLTSIAQALKNAKVPEDVFGEISGDRIRALTTVYRKMVQVVHPDHHNGKDTEAEANLLFVELTAWRDKAERKIRAKTYGDRKPVVEKKPPRSGKMEPQTIRTPKREYRVTGLLFEGDIADLYACAYRDGHDEVNAVFKIAQSPADNDLMEVESKALPKILVGADDSSFYKYIPKLVDSFMLRGKKNTRRRVNVLHVKDGYVPLSKVMEAYPDGLDFRDVVWMLKRMLVAAGFVAQEKNAVYGNFIPPNVWVGPVNHGAVLMDWTAAVRGHQDGIGRLRVFSKAYKDYYPPEVFSKRVATPSLDVYMIGKCAVALLGGDVTTNQMPNTVPPQFRAFLQGMLIEAPTRRPDDAWALHEELDDLLLRLVGKPKYRKLRMPAAA